MSLGLIVSTPTDLSLAITAIDRDAAALKIAAAATRDLAARLGRPAVALETIVADATSERTRLPEADLIVAGTLLNELAPAAALALVLRALTALAPEGALIILEPALRETSRALHELRDAVIGSGAAHVFAPCVRKLAPCPALADPTDWCHEDRAVKLPPRTAELARLTHLRDHGLKFSYLVLRKVEGSVVDQPGAWRVVGAPRSQKGKLEVPGCCDLGKLPLRLLRRNRAGANRDLERADRGDVVIVDAAAGPERVEVLDTTTVVRRDPSRAPSSS